MIVMLGMDWRLALASFIVLPLIAVVTQWFRANVRESYRTVRAWIARINTFLQENITGMATVQLFRREGRNATRFDEINAAHRDANIDSIFYYAVFYPAIELVGALAASIIIWVGGLNVLDGTLTLGVLVAFLQYSARFYRPISDMSEKFNVLQSAMASSERIFTLLDTPVAVASPSDASVGRPAAAGAHRVRPRLVCLPERRLGAARRVVRGPAGTAPGAGGRHRVGQDDDHQPAAAVLRHPARSHPGGRRRHPGPRPGDVAGAVRARAAGRPPVLGHAGRQHPAGARRPRRSGRARRGRGRGRLRLHRGTAGRLRRAGRRARRDAVDRPEAAAVVCPCAGLQPARARSSTRPPPASTPRPRRRFARRSRC